MIGLILKLALVFGLLIGAVHHAAHSETLHEQLNGAIGILNQDVEVSRHSLDATERLNFMHDAIQQEEFVNQILGSV